MTYRAVFEDSQGSSCLVVEDDGAAAWASLVVAGEVVSAVWLYNGSSEVGLPRNEARLVSDQPVIPQLSRLSEVEVAWDEAGATLLVDGVESARLEPGRDPGWSRQAAEDGPLALVLRADDGRPKPLTRLEYLVLVERLAKQVVSKVRAEGRVELYGERALLTPADRAVADLARSLRHIHFPGDGCVDESGEQRSLPYIPSAELIQRAHEHYLTEGDEADQRYWSVIHELRRRGTRVEFELARSLIAQGDADGLGMGCDVLAQLGASAGRPGGEWAFREESLPLLLPWLEHEDPVVRTKAASALGHLGLDGLEDRVIALAGDTSKDVRFAVAVALGGRDDDASLRALTLLSADADSEVRDWATFGLGSQTERDEPWIRDALLARVEDLHIDTAVEGMLGLARCSDPRGLPTLRAWLEAGAEYTGMLDAAADYAEPSLLPLLEPLRASVTDESSDWVACLDRAIAACAAPR